MIASSSSTLRSLWRHLCGHRALTAAVFLLALLEAFFSAASISALIPVSGSILQPGNSQSVPWPLGWLVAVVGSDPARLLLLLAALLVTKVIIALLKVALTAHLRRIVWQSWSLKLVKRFIFMPYSQWLKQDSGELINLVGYEVNRCTSLLSVAISVATNLLSCAMLILALLLADWRVVVVGLCGVGLLYIFGMRRINLHAARYGALAVQLARVSAGLLSETMQGVRDIRLLGAEKKRLTDVEEVVRKSTNNDFHLSLLQAIPANAVELVLAIVVLCAALVLMIPNFSITASAFPIIIFFVVAIFRLSTYAASLSTLHVKLVGRWPSMITVLNALNDEANRDHRDGVFDGDVVPEHQYLNLRPLEGFSIRELTFRHNDRVILDSVSLDLPLGSVTYLFGPSGSGKSTLADLVARLHEPPTGALLLDRFDATKLPIEVWRKIVGYVSQDPVLFSGTLHDNVAIGMPNTSEDDVANALIEAGAEDLLSREGGGLYRMLSERGRNLSGGQRCRIAIARCLLRKPALIILDESTGGLEGDLELDIVERLRRRADLAVLIVSHRHEAATAADQVVSIHAAKIQVDRALPVDFRVNK